MLATPSDPCESHAAFVVTALRHRLRVQLTGDGAETAAAEFSTAWRHLLSSDDRDSDRELTIHVPDDEPGSIATAQARAHVLRYRQAMPRERYALRLQAMCDLQEGKAQDALTLLEPAIAAAPQDIDLLALGGEAAMRAGKQELAARWFGQASALAPESGGLLAASGLSLLSQGQDARALEALELAMEQWPVKLILLTPNCNNPLGYIMPDARKRALLSLAQRYDVPILEDDVYGELAYAYPRPRSIKSFDSDDRVLLASSFSKTVAPGLRTGWVVPGRYLDRILHLKYIASGTCAPQPQMALAEFVGGGHYEPHIRRMRAQYQRHRDLMTDWIARYFPEGTRATGRRAASCSGWSCTRSSTACG